MKILRTILIAALMLSLPAAFASSLNTGSGLNNSGNIIIPGGGIVLPGGPGSGWNGEGDNITIPGSGILIGPGGGTLVIPGGETLVIPGSGSVSGSGDDTYENSGVGESIPAFPETGDGAELMLWSSLLLASAVGMTAMLRRKHSRI